MSLYFIKVCFALFGASFYLFKSLEHFLPLVSWCPYITFSLFDRHSCLYQLSECSYNLCRTENFSWTKDRPYCLWTNCVKIVNSAHWGNREQKEGQKEERGIKEKTWNYPYLYIWRVTYPVWHAGRGQYVLTKHTYHQAMGKFSNAKQTTWNIFLGDSRQRTPTVARESRKSEAKFIPGNGVKLSS